MPPHIVHVLISSIADMAVLSLPQLETLRNLMHALGEIGVNYLNSKLPTEHVGWVCGHTVYCPTASKHPEMSPSVVCS